MADTTETARLILMAESVGFPDTRNKIAQLEADLSHLQTMYKAGAVTIDDYREHGGRLLGELDDLRGGLKTAEDAVKKFGDAQKAAAALASQSQSKLAGTGQSFLQLGRVVQDFTQGGIGGILNNIEGLSVALGGGAGLAGVLTILGTAFYVFKPQIQEFFASFLNKAPDVLRGRIEAIKEQIEGLEKKPVKVGADYTELTNARKELEALSEARKAFEEFGKLRPEAAEVSGKEVQKALAEAPGGAGAVEEALTRARERSIRGEEGPEARALQTAQAEQAAAQQAVKESEAAIRDEGLPEFTRVAIRNQLERQKEAINDAQGRINDATDALRKRAEEEIGDLFKRAKEGDVARQRELQEQLTAVGRPELAARIRGISPENIRARELEEQGGMIQAEALEELRKGQEEQAKEDVEALEQQLHNQGVIEKDLAKTTADARKQQEAAEKRRLATLARRVGGGTLGEEAQDYAARVQERQPGISDADLRAAVQAAVAQEVARRAPQLAPAERAGVVGAVTEQALAAPPEDVAARQARQAAALPRRERAEMQAGYTQEAQMQGFNPQAAAEIGRRATAGFERTGKLQESLFAAIDEFQALIAAQQQHIAAMENGIGRVRAGNAALQARQRTAARNGGMN